MQIELSREEAETLRDLLREKVTDLDKEINRTDRFDFKKELQQIDRRLERMLGAVSAALEGAPRA